MYFKIEIPFDENIYTRQCMLKWTLTNQKTSKNVKSTLIGWAIVLTIGILTGIEEGQYVNGFTIVGVIFFVYGLWMLTQLVKGKREYKKQLNEMTLELKNKNHIADYEFTDSYIRYVDKQRDI